MYVYDRINQIPLKRHGLLLSYTALLEINVVTLAIILRKTPLRIQQKNNSTKNNSPKDSMNVINC